MDSNNALVTIVLIICLVCSIMQAIMHNKQQNQSTYDEESRDDFYS